MTSFEKARSALYFILPFPINRSRISKKHKACVQACVSKGVGVLRGLVSVRVCACRS